MRIDISKDVEIDITVRNRPKARTYNYSYNANTPKGGSLIRYCGPDDPNTISKNN